MKVFNKAVVAVGCIAALLGLAGCSAISYDLQKTWEYALRKEQNVVLTAEQIAEFPYTAMYGRMDGGGQVLVVLAFVDKTGAEARLNWVTGASESFTTEQGRIIRTTGLDVNLVGVSAVTADPLRCVLAAGCATEWLREIDFVGGSETGTETVRSNFVVMGSETLNLPTGPKQVVRIKEEGRFVRAGELFINTFWLEPDGHVVKSRQQLLPGAKALELTQVKWVGRND